MGGITLILQTRVVGQGYSILKRTPKGSAITLNSFLQSELYHYETFLLLLVMQLGLLLLFPSSLENLFL
jgi:hypothetical protein